MIWMIASILVILWLPGFVSSYTMGGFIHVLLIFAVAAILVNIVQRRKAALSGKYHKPNR